MLSDEAPKCADKDCKLILAERNYHTCTHCGLVFCATHIHPHAVKVEFNLKTVPGLVKA